MEAKSNGDWGTVNTYFTSGSLSAVENMTNRQREQGVLLNHEIYTQEISTFYTLSRQ